MTELAAHGDVLLRYEIVISHEQDGSWTAAIEKLGVRASGATDVEARSKAQALALRAIADQIEHDRSAPDKISFDVWLG
jgi:predicted RNase H-like HicB family nuclease